jgi:hypothetical protein
MSQNATATTTSKKGLTTKHVVLILGALIIICAAVVIAIFLLNKPEPATTPVITESNLKEIQGEIQEKVAKGMFMTHMNTTWTFPDGGSPSSDAVMGNAAGNNYPFWFTLTLPDTEETLLQSGLIPTGSQLSEVKLSRDLDKGTYPALITIHMVDENGEEVESNMGFNITLEVQN